MFRSPLWLVITLAVLACDYGADDLDSMQLPLNEPSFWTVGPAIVATPTWSSGSTKNLSAWKILDCTTKLGGQATLRDLRLYREPSSNLDNFVARLDGRCAELTYACENCPSVEVGTYATLYSGNYRPGATLLSAQNAHPSEHNVDAGPFPSGLSLRLDLFAGYVKDLKLFATWGNAYEPYGTYTLVNYYGGATGWAWGLDGTMDAPTDLRCGYGQVLTGLRLRYDVTNGKIRDVRLQCRSLEFTPLY